jgi:guanylate kinase
VVTEPSENASTRGRLVVLSGPSAVGKDTVIGRVVELLPELRRSVSHTSRAARAGEVDGREYRFVGRDQFEAMRVAGEFLETATVHGNRYGTAAAQVERLLAKGHDVVLKIDVQGAAQVRRIRPDALFIFLAPPSREELLQRLRQRETESPAELETRTRDADSELAEAPKYQYLVVNDEVERAAREIAAIVDPSFSRPR